MPHEQLQILVVDDDDGHRELVRRNLKRSGITNEIISFSEGESALDFIFCRGEHANRPGNSHLIVLLDINMPGIGGVEVLRQIKSDPYKSKIPVIMLTTTDDPREVDRCYSLGCSSYITKPVEPQAFLDAIGRMGLYISIISIPTEDGKK